MPAAVCGDRPSLMSQMRLQVAELLGIEFKNEVRRKTFAVAPDLLVQTTCFHAIERGQVSIKQYLLSAQ